MPKSLLLVALPLLFSSLLFSSLASAQVVINLSRDGVVVKRRTVPQEGLSQEGLSQEGLSREEAAPADRSRPAITAALATNYFGETRVSSKGFVPTSNTTWVVPRFSIDDSSANGDSTFVSVRRGANALLRVSVSVEYLDEAGVLIDQQTFVLSRHQTRVLDLRDNPVLVNPGGISTGIVVVKSDRELVVDYFQLDFGDNFASGGVAPRLTDFCDSWVYRFLTFGGNSGSRITFIDNAPNGLEPADPSITGTVYNEAGTAINDFELFTNLVLNDFAVSELALEGTSFGSMEITIHTRSSIQFPGYVTLRHNAFGRFSVGLDAVCGPSSSPSTMVGSQ